MARSSAATVAPRRKPAQRGGKHASTQTHRRTTRRSSGPAKGRPHANQRAVAATGTHAGSVAAPARRAKPQPQRKAQTAPLVRRLADGRTGAVLDRLLRGRACVLLVFFLLVGIVFSNVSLMEMNKGIAATDAEATAIAQENAKLRRQVAPLASSERIQREAVKRGYSLPAAGDVGFIRGTLKANAKRAAQRITAPGMGEGTASRPAAQVEQEGRAQTQTTTAPQPTAPQPTPATPQPVAAQPTPAAPQPAPVEPQPVAAQTPPPVTQTQAPPTTTAP